MIPKCMMGNVAGSPQGRRRSLPSRSSTSSKKIRYTSHQAEEGASGWCPHGRKTFLVPEEACRAGRWTRPLDVMAAVEPACGVAQIP